jgi:hypothetical protein
VACITLLIIAEEMGIMPTHGKHITDMAFIQMANLQTLLNKRYHWMILEQVTPTTAI